MSDPNLTKTQPLGIDMPLVFVVGAIGVILVFCTITAIQGWFHYQMDQELLVKSYAQADPALQDLRDQQIARIASYGYVDQSKGLVRIPIDRAMELVVRDAQAQPGQP